MIGAFTIYTATATDVLFVNCHLSRDVFDRMKILYFQVVLRSLYAIFRADNSFQFHTLITTSKRVTFFFFFENNAIVAVNFMEVVIKQKQNRLKTFVVVFIRSNIPTCPIQYSDLILKSLEIRRRFFYFLFFKKAPLFNVNFQIIKNCQQQTKIN